MGKITWRKVRIHPWVGALYGNSDLLSYKTLILGESNYTTEENFNSGLVIECIQDHIEENTDSNFSMFATKIRRVILGRKTKTKPKEFWDNVSFYNFIQYRVGDSKKIRPTQEMWNDSVQAFEELIDKIQPERMLVLGKENWSNLLQHIKHERTNDDQALLLINGVKLIAGYIYHPSAGGGYFSYMRCGSMAAEIVPRKRL